MSASYLLAAAATIEEDGLLWTAREVRDYLVKLADGLEPASLDDLGLLDRIPLSGPHIADAIGRLFFRSELPASDYGRCVQVSQLFGDCANRLDVKEDHARADLLREYAHAVSKAGGAL